MFLCFLCEQIIFWSLSIDLRRMQAPRFQAISNVKRNPVESIARHTYVLCSIRITLIASKCVVLLTHSIYIIRTQSIILYHCTFVLPVLCLFSSYSVVFYKYLQCLGTTTHFDRVVLCTILPILFYQFNSGKMH